MGIDWTALFVPKSSFAELVIRGSVMYLMLFVLLRTLVRRRVGALSITDLLLSQLRQQGVEDAREVKTAFIEADGRISVIKSDSSARAADTQSAKRKDRAV
jgi:uncharacterized membrane protein YcaP (DUF421 family)